MTYSGHYTDTTSWIRFSCMWVVTFKVCQCDSNIQKVLLREFKQGSHNLLHNLTIYIANIHVFYFQNREPNVSFMKFQNVSHLNGVSFFAEFNVSVTKKRYNLWYLWKCVEDVNDLTNVNVDSKNMLLIIVLTFQTGEEITMSLLKFDSNLCIQNLSRHKI